MNYPYISERHDNLRAILAASPSASLDQIRRSHPALRAMSLDQLALRLGRLGGEPTSLWLK